ncbi:MAG: methionyl-tRNA formyltransferase [Prevotella sp.]|nr:methionyl-tRNA formyltransferase [Bacteroides sp.]MCM1366521.1 methionyl-tRNA formyltransferase [Prevotella sp.]
MNKRIVFFGTPEFAVESLKALVDNGYEIVAVVTMPDKKAGRGNKIIYSDVKKYAIEAGLPLMQPENLKDADFISQLKSLDASLFIVIAFRMLPKEVWQMPGLGTFNLHASLLPKYRGAAPINRAVMNGETETGVTTFFLKHEIDTGDIIEQRHIDIKPEENVGDVYDKLMRLGAEMVIHTVDKIFDGTVTTTSQPDGEFTPAPKIFAEDCKIDFRKQAIDIHNQIRGLSPYPGARACLILNTETKLDCKLFETKLTSEESYEAPGTIKITRNRMLVSCGDNWLEIISIQPAGKKRMDVSAFLLGYSPSKFIIKE